MELRYCEECGDMIRVGAAEPQSLSEHFVCEKCKGGQRRGAGPRSTAGSGPEEALRGESLELFSHQTIALHKQRNESLKAAQDSSKSSRLRLVRPGEGPAPNRADSTIVASPEPPVADGSALPARSAQKILFRCLHCRSALSIRPVEKTSKLECPFCKKQIFVTATGQLFTSSPSAAARTYAREAEAQAQEPAARTPETPASSRLPASARCPARPPSQAVLRDAPPASGSAGPAPAAPPSAPVRTVRLLSENPRAEPRKPPSAFEEHQARRDPDKTLFITEETTTDLSHVASSEAFRGAAQSLDAGPSPQGEAGDAGAGESAHDETEIIEDPGAQVQTAVQAGLKRASAQPEAKPRKKGLTSRVLKAIFTP